MPDDCSDSGTCCAPPEFRAHCDAVGVPPAHQCAGFATPPNCTAAPQTLGEYWGVCKRQPFDDLATSKFGTIPPEKIEPALNFDWEPPSPLNVHHYAILLENSPHYLALSYQGGVWVSAQAADGYKWVYDPTSGYLYQYVSTTIGASSVPTPTCRYHSSLTGPVYWPRYYNSGDGVFCFDKTYSPPSADYALRYSCRVPCAVGVVKFWCAGYVLDFYGPKDYLYTVVAETLYHPCVIPPGQFTVPQRLHYAPARATQGGVGPYTGIRWDGPVVTVGNFEGYNQWQANLLYGINKPCRFVPSYGVVDACAPSDALPQLTDWDSSTLCGAVTVRWNENNAPNFSVGDSHTITVTMRKYAPENCTPCIESPPPC